MIKIVNEIIINGNLKTIDKTNLTYLEPHRIIINDITFLAFNYSNEIKIDCEITQNGFRTGLLSEFIKKKFMIKQNHKLKFMIVENNSPKPYDVYWKVRNVGYEAIRRNFI